MLAQARYTKDPISVSDTGIALKAWQTVLYQAANKGVLVERIVSNSANSLEWCE